MKISRLACFAFLISAVLPQFLPGQQRAGPATDLWNRENLAAWCIVPFDSKNRGPEERAEMLNRLGFKQLAYDWRAKHIPTFDEEVEAMARHHIEIVAWWFPTALNDDAQKILAVIGRHKIHPQLWVMGSGAPAKNAVEQKERIEREADRIRPIAKAAAQLGCKVGLYNHGGWFGDPENELAVLERLKSEGLDNIGLVYNFHHGHNDIDRFDIIWPRIMTHVLAVSLNGMVHNGDKIGKNDLYLSEGDHEVEMMRVIQRSGWRGGVNIISDRNRLDAEMVLKANLDGLEKVVAQLQVEPAPAAGTPTSSGTKTTVK